MEPRLTRAEYWLLQSVVELQVPLHWLGDERRLLAMLNKPSHGLDRERLAAVLEQLFDAGWLFSQWRDSTESFRPSRPQIERALAAEAPAPADWLYYGLTALGGTAWEAFAWPRWERFVDEELYYPEHEPSGWAAMMGADREFLEGRFRWICAAECHPYCWQRPLAETARWQTLQPWQATYWKELPVGYRLEHQFANDEERTGNITAGFPSHFPRWHDCQI
jgi:hypothetical protein